MSGDGRLLLDTKYEKESEDLEVALLPESSTNDRKPEYGGFTDEIYNELVNYHQTKEIPKRLQGHLKHRIDCFKRKAKRFQLIEGTDQLIYIGFKPDQSTVGQFVVKKGDVEKILAQAHLETNHGGLNATRKMVSSKFYWNSITNDVEQFIKQCPRCRVTRMRYVASNNVPWRKSGGRYGDIYASWDESDDDYGLLGNRTWKIAGADEYMTYAPDIEGNMLPPPYKRVRSGSEVIVADEMSNDDVDIENDAEELVSTEQKIDPQMFLPQYFRVKPNRQAYNGSRQPEWVCEQVLEYDETYGSPMEAYYEEDYLDGEAVETSEVLEDGMEDGSPNKADSVKCAVFKEKTIESSTAKRRYMDNGRECIIETDKKYFMVEAEQLLQLFRRCLDCGENLKQVTLYADSQTPMVAYQCSNCEPALWFGQKIE